MPRRCAATLFVFENGRTISFSSCVLKLVVHLYLRENDSLCFVHPPTITSVFSKAKIFKKECLLEEMSSLLRTNQCTHFIGDFRS